MENRLTRTGRKRGRRAEREKDCAILRDTEEMNAAIEMREELSVARREIRKRRKREAYRQARVAELRAVVPDDRVCPGCGRLKKKTNQWTRAQIGDVVVACCIGCKRKMSKV